MQQQSQARSLINGVYFSQSEAGIPDPGVGETGPPGHADGRLLPVSSQGHASVCVCVLTSSYKDPSPVGSAPTLVTSSQVDHLQRPCFRLRLHPQVLSVMTPTSLGDTGQCKAQRGQEMHCPTPSPGEARQEAGLVLARALVAEGATWDSSPHLVVAPGRCNRRPSVQN